MGANKTIEDEEAEIKIREEKKYQCRVGVKSKQ